MLQYNVTNVTTVYDLLLAAFFMYYI